VNLEDRIKNPDEAEEDDEAAGEKIHDESLGMFERVGADQHFDTENQEKNGKDADNQIFKPP